MWICVVFLAMYFCGILERLTFLLEVLIALTVLHRNELMTFNILYFNY